MGRGIDPTRITILCIISSGQSTNTGQKIQEISFRLHLYWREMHQETNIQEL